VSQGETRALSGTGQRVSAADCVEIALIVLTGYGCHLYYNLVGHLASLRGVDLGPVLLTPLDRSIPFSPGWVWFYQLCYFAPLVALVLLLPHLLRDIGATRRIIIAFLSMLLLHFTLYLVFPTSARSVRVPESSLGSGLLGALVRYEYRIATVWCAWPSLHVSAAWFFFRVLARVRRWAGLVYLVWFCGMFVGTFAIKIHYVADAMTGLIIGECAYRFILLRLDRAGAFADWGHNRTLRLLAHVAFLALLIAGLPLLMKVSGFLGPLYVIIPGD